MAILASVGGASLAAYIGMNALLKTEELKSAVALLRPRAAKGEVGTLGARPW